MSDTYGDTSTDERDSTRGRGASSNATAKWAGGIVIGAVVLLALLRGAFNGRAF